MSDQDALLAAIRAHPDEDTPRLAYADWLQENGQPERAEFIRVQVELAGMPRRGKGRARLQEREKELLALPAAAYIPDEMRPREGSKTDGFIFRRGFLEQVVLDPRHLPYVGPVIDTIPDLRCVRLRAAPNEYDKELKMAQHIATQPWFQHIHYVQLEGNYGSYTRLWADLLRQPQAHHLETIDFLCGNFNPNHYAQAPAEMHVTSHLQNLRHVNFRYYNPLEDILESPPPNLGRQYAHGVFENIRNAMNNTINFMQAGELDQGCSLINLQDINGIKVPADIRRMQSQLRELLRERGRLYEVSAGPGTGVTLA